MSRKKEFIVKLFNKMFVKPSKESENRRLTINKKTGKINWSEGELPLGEGPDEKEIAEAMKSNTTLLEDDPEKGVRLFKATPIGYEVYRKNRFEIYFPGIQPLFFQSYSYIGTTVRSEKRLLRSNKVIKEEYSSFKVLMIFPHEFDICEKLIELEESPMVGDIKIGLLDSTGVLVKTILMPDCEVTEIKVFKDLDYGGCLDKSDSLLFGEIIVKHKHRRLI